MPNARNTDPHTSHEAAMSISWDNMTRTQQIILILLETPMNDEQLVDTYMLHQRVNPKFVPQATPSGIRSRRNELATAGRVEIIDHGTTRSGRKCHIWKRAN
jgi:hypothetical protein